MIKEKELIGKLESQYKEYLYEKYTIPKPYYENLNNVKAVLLGSNPVALGEMAEIDYVFNLGNFNTSQRASPIFGNIYNNLDAIGLDLKDIYAQNLCKNYFINLSVHDEKWVEIASYWADVLRTELDILFNKEVPVLITAPWILKPLCSKVNYSKYYYEYKKFIQPESNKLGRLLIPFFRQYEFSLLDHRWDNYKEMIRDTFKV